MGVDECISEFQSTTYMMKQARISVEEMLMPIPQSQGQISVEREM